ncbi:hypothetical protein GCM10007863_38920 [Dyella mobilis]|nr:hypothetical protein GCM10007863_38920 [Dyella mobilis]
MRAKKAKLAFAAVISFVSIYATSSIAQSTTDPQVVPLIRPLYTLVSCTLTPPAGYVWSGVRQNALCGNVGQAAVEYVFESYFDKPVGTTLQICSANFVPAGWFIIPNVGTLGPCKQYWTIIRNS